MVTIFAVYIFGFRFGFVQDGWHIQFEARPVREDFAFEEVDFYAWEQEEQAKEWAAEVAHEAELDAAEAAAEYASRPLSPYHFHDRRWAEEVAAETAYDLRSEWQHSADR